MPSWIAWLTAFVSIAAFTAIWFWETRRILQGYRSTMESAARQLEAHKKIAASQRNSENVEIMERCESIYRQAAEHYNHTLHRPWLYLPGRLLGFHPEEI